MLNDKNVAEYLTGLLTNSAKQTYSITEAAAYLKIPEDSVKYYSHRAKELSHANLGGVLVFRRCDLDEFLEKKLKKGFV